MKRVVWNIVALVFISLFFSCGEENETTNPEIKAMLSIGTKTEGETIVDFTESFLSLFVKKGSMTDEDYPGGGKIDARYEEGKWKLDKTVELADYPAYIYACYPGGEIVNGKISVWNGNNYMYAGGNNVASASKPYVSLTLKHAMTFVGLNIKKGSYTGAGELTVIGVRRSNVSHNGKYFAAGLLDLETGEIIEDIQRDDSGYFDVKSNFKQTITANGWSDASVPGVELFPFKAYAEEIIVDYTIDGRTYSLNLPAMEYVKGKKYLIDITLNAIENISLRCVDWDAEHVDLGTVPVTIGGLRFTETVTTKNLTVTIPDMGNVNATIDWGDGKEESYKVGATHIYAQPGTYTIQVKTWDTISSVSMSIANRNFISFRGDV